MPRLRAADCVYPYTGLPVTLAPDIEYGAAPTGNMVGPTLRHMSTLSAHELDVLWPTVKSLLPQVSRTELNGLLDSLPPESPIELTATPTRIELITPRAFISVERPFQVPRRNR